MANHSCIPNAMVQFVGRRAVLRAETDIQAGQEIEISYTGTQAPKSPRPFFPSPR
jgi:SET and MYND domain-containing protein